MCVQAGFFAVDPRQLNSSRDVDLGYAPPGVDATSFRPPESNSVMETRYSLCVARFSDPRKNIGLLLEAYARLPQKMREEVPLVLAGASGPLGSFWRRADVLGLRHRIRFVQRPSKTELVRLYQGASVFALPLDEEGLGIVVLEAITCGVPVFATRSGAPDAIVSEAESPFLAKLDDSAEVAARLAHVLEDLKLQMRMGNEARETVEPQYDERVAGEVFIDMWNLMAHKAGIA